MIKNIIFDMGGVLLHYDPSRFVDLLSVEAQDRTLLMREVFRSVEWVRMDRGSIGEEEASAAMKERLPKRLHGAVDRLMNWWELELRPMEGMEELEDLRTYLRGVFSQELADRLLDGGSSRIQYRDVNGVLYAAGDIRDRDAGKGQVQVEVERLEDGLYFINVTVDLLGEDRETVVGLESWSFPYAFVEDRWVFTDFRLVY